MLGWNLRRGKLKWCKNLEESIKIVRQRSNELAIDNLKKRLQSPRLRSPGTIKIYIQTGKIFMNWLPHSPPADSADFRAFFTWRRENHISERSLRTEFFQIKKLAEANDWEWTFIKEDTPVSKTKAFAPAHSIDEIKKMISSRMSGLLKAKGSTWLARQHGDAGEKNYPK